MNKKYICTMPFKIRGEQVYEIDLKSAFPGRDITKIWIAREGSNRVKVCVAAPEEVQKEKTVAEDMAELGKKLDEQPIPMKGRTFRTA